MVLTHPLTKLSIENGSVPVEVPDFTRGAWNKIQAIDTLSPNKKKSHFMKPTFLSHFLTPILLFCGVATLPLQAQSYKDPTLSPEERTTDLLRRMTLEEKIAQIRHIHSWNIFDEQDLNETKLQEFVGDLCWGFVEGFPLTGESCHRHMRAYKNIW